MTEESENNAPEKNEMPEPSTEPLSVLPSSDQPDKPFIPPMPLRQLEATYEMLVHFKAAILGNEWHGDAVQAVAMGLEMIKQMEGQYRVQVEMARQREKEQVSALKAQIQKGGGVVSGAKETVH